MIKKIFKTLFKTAVKTGKGTAKSMDMLDNLLEKEYLTTAADNVKTSAGKVIEKAGMVYQQSIDKIEENIDLDKVTEVKEKASEKLQNLQSELTDSMLEGAETIKSVFKEGEKMVKGFSEEE